MRRQAKRGRRKSEARFRGLAESNLFGIFFMDRDSRVTSANEKLLEMIGHTREELASGDIRWDSLVPVRQAQSGHCPSGEPARPSAGERAAPPTDLPVVAEYIRKDGRQVPILIAVTPLDDSDGRAIGFALDLTEQTRETEELRSRYAREHEIARTLQRSLVHAMPALCIHGLEVATRCQAAWTEADVGGDFCDAFALDGGLVAIMTGDITGKGLVAASRIAEMKYALRAFLREDPRPASALARLNEFLCAAHRLDSPPESHHLCLALAVAHPETGEITFATGGAEPPLILHPDGQADEVFLGCLPLGIAGEARYTSVSRVLQAGDLVLIVTDGITEARRGNEFLGYDGMVELFRAARPLGSLDSIAQAVMDGAAAFAGGHPHDDSCLLLARLQ
jgi:serine phosphatase RsbU (regulator of sigma subunit)